MRLPACRRHWLPQVTWVCQTAPQPSHLPILPACGLTLDLHVSPAQVSSWKGHTAACSAGPCCSV